MSSPVDLLLTCLGPLDVGRVPGLVDWLCTGLEGEEESNQGWSPKLKSLVSFGVESCLLTKMS